LGIGRDGEWGLGTRDSQYLFAANKKKEGKAIVSSVGQIPKPSAYSNISTKHRTNTQAILLQIGSFLAAKGNLGHILPFSNLLTVKGKMIKI
jgi:hypothetical protein